ncbi:MAG TPA: hypothetical protein VLB46_12995 [Pyrinomonadaceae bacterium]|nr:hypothetical protein [Pyrinomonadaceae bacterium]
MTRLEQLDKQIARLKRRGEFLNTISRKYWNVRRIIFVAGALLALAFCNFSGSTVAWFVAALIAIIFAVVTIYHTRVRDSITRNTLLIEIKQVQIARINLDWDRIPAAAPDTPIAGHPFASDLDITGERSLHRLLDCAVTKEGSERLKSWLLNPRPDAVSMAHRQKLVRELKDHSVFRDKLQLLSAFARLRTAGPTRSKSRSSHWNSKILVDWIEQSGPMKSLVPTLLALTSLAVLNLICIWLWLEDLIPRVWPLAFLIYVATSLLSQRKIATAWDELQDLEKALTHFKAVFSYLESRCYQNTPGLAEICSPFGVEGKQPSIEIRKLGRLAAALGVRTNPLLSLLFNALVPWDFYFSYKLELVKKEIAHLLPRWLDAWHELETLNSLANFAYLNPGYVFPELKPGRFATRSLGHPLLKPEAKVCNDFELNDDQRIVILTGSNMAGKSTFLRTVGVNLALAYAGAPVNATSMQTSLFLLFTCIKVSDSVQDGLSYFYAEVKRLQALLAATEVDDELPVLFLIDEIFRGTNSRERLIGSRSYIRSLSQRRTMGLIATHDLELIKLADEIKGVTNYHFREEVLDSRMVFDYRLRPGPCPTTNALKIMRIEGLPVET